MSKQSITIQDDRSGTEVAVRAAAFRNALFNSRFIELVEAVGRSGGQPVMLHEGNAADPADLNSWALADVMRRSMIVGDRTTLVLQPMFTANGASGSLTITPIGLPKAPLHRDDTGIKIAGTKRSGYVNKLPDPYLWDDNDYDNDLRLGSRNLLNERYYMYLGFEGTSEYAAGVGEVDRHAINKGALIQSAELRLYRVPGGVPPAPTTVKIHGLDYPTNYRYVNDNGNWDELGFLIDNYLLGEVEWTLQDGSGGAWGENEWSGWIDVTEILQELVSRPWWTHQQDINLIIDGGEPNATYDYYLIDGLGGNAPELRVEYVHEEALLPHDYIPWYVGQSKTTSIGSVAFNQSGGGSNYFPPMLVWDVAGAPAIQVHVGAQSPSNLEWQIWGMLI